MKRFVSGAVGLCALLASVVVVVAPAAGAEIRSGVVVPTPLPAGAHSELHSVSCPSASMCLAVGYFQDGEQTRALAQVWGGTGWTIVDTPDDEGHEGSRLLSVSCTSVSACTAVGQHQGASAIQTLIETWDGTGWSIVPSPDTSPALFNRLTSVSCTTPTHCVAVGYHQTVDGLSRALALLWDGSTWTITPSPDPSPTHGDALGSVSCVSEASCTAVGSRGGEAGGRPLIQTWDGTAWSVVPSPSPEGGGSGLSSVSCPSVAWCVAVGGHVVDGAARTLVDVWDGAAWTSSPSSGIAQAQEGSLSSVWCSSASWCVAAGTSVVDGVGLTLVEAWDGTTWANVPTADVEGARLNELSSVACASDTLCFAVGRAQVGQPITSLVLAMTDALPPSAPVPAPLPPESGAVAPAFTG